MFLTLPCQPLLSVLASVEITIKQLVHCGLQSCYFQSSCLFYFVHLFLQAALEKEKTLEEGETGETKEEELPAQVVGHASASVESLTSQMNELGVCSNPALVTPSSDSTEDSNPGGPVQDIDKKIRALKKKV